MTSLEVKILKWIPRPLGRLYENYTDVCRFIIVGGLATFVHYSVALLTHHLFGLSPLWANFLAFLIAFNVTYIGNYFWAFEADSDHKTSLPKSLAVSVTGLALSQIIVWGLTERLAFPFHLTLIFAVTLVPMVTFSLNRFWVFKEKT